MAFLSIEFQFLDKFERFDRDNCSGYWETGT